MTPAKSCHHCGYERSENPKGACPECGVLDSASLRSALGECTLRAWRSGASGWAAGCAIGLSLIVGSSIVDNWRPAKDIAAQRTEFLLTVSLALSGLACIAVSGFMLQRILRHRCWHIVLRGARTIQLVSLIALVLVAGCLTAAFLARSVSAVFPARDLSQSLATSGIGWTPFVAVWTMAWLATIASAVASAVVLQRAAPVAFNDEQVARSTHVYRWTSLLGFVSLALIAGLWLGYAKPEFAGSIRSFGAIGVVVCAPVWLVVLVRLLMSLTRSGQTADGGAPANVIHHV